MGPRKWWAAQYFLPERDVRGDLLEPSPTPRGAIPIRRPARHRSPAISTFRWDAVDEWYEEDEQIFGHPADPYHRVDVRESSRHVRVLLDGEVLADTHRPRLLLAACADAASAAPANDAGSPSSSPSGRPPRQNPPPSSLPTGSSRGPSDQIKPLTVRGMLEAGRQPGCRELVTATSRFVLVGELSRDLRVGNEFEVTGLPAPQLRTACDGIVLQLHRVRRR